MNYHKDLDPSLKRHLEKVKSNVKWNSVRQQKVRNNLISVIEKTQLNKSNVIKSSIRKRLAPVAALLLIVGISVILFVNGDFLKHETTTGYTNKAQTLFETIEYEISENIKQDINAIIDSGFELKLPTYSLEEMKVIDLIQGEEKSKGMNVDIVFSFQNNKQFHLNQKDIETQTQALISQGDADMEVIDIIINDRNADTSGEPIEFIINNKFLAYLTETDSDKTLYLFTDQYEYSLHSQDLSTEQMVMLMESIDLAN